MMPKAGFPFLSIANKIIKALSLLFCLLICPFSGAVALDPQFILQPGLTFSSQTLTGFEGLSAKIVGPDGRFFFYSPSLNQKPFIQQEDQLSELLYDLDKSGYNEASGFKVFLDISELSQSRFKLSAKKFSGLVTGLSSHYVFSDILHGSLSSETQNFTFLAAVESGKKLNLKVSSPGFERYVLNAAKQDKNLTRSPHRWVTEETTASLTTSDVAFALGQSLKIPVWASSQEDNLLRYRAIKNNPSGFLLNEENSELRQELIEMDQMQVRGSSRPIANLILGPTSEPNYTFPQMLWPIINALSANGYELRVSFESFVKGADLYYVVGRHNWLDNLVFFKEILKILDHRHSKFYGPVILHPMGEIKNGSLWKDLRKHFFIPATESGWVKEIPVYVKERGRSISWGGSAHLKRGMSFLRADKIRDQGGEVLLSELLGTQTLSLILKSKNHYLVNGFPLHLEAGYILSKLAGGALRAPVMAAVASGRYRTAVYAIEDTFLSLQIPSKVLPVKWRMRHYDEEGFLAEDAEISSLPQFEMDLKRHELLILQALSR